MSLATVTFIKMIGKSTSLWTMQWCGSMLYQVHGGVHVLCCAVTNLKVVMDVGVLAWVIVRCFVYVLGQ